MVPTFTFGFKLSDFSLFQLFFTFLTFPWLLGQWPPCLTCFSSAFSTIRAQLYRGRWVRTHRTPSATPLQNSNGKLLNLVFLKNFSMLVLKLEILIQNRRALIVVWLLLSCSGEGACYSFINIQNWIHKQNFCWIPIKTFGARAIWSLHFVITLFFLSWNHLVVLNICVFLIS